ncbi:MAG: hypothetical protein QM743_02570 [Chitinophagaceae bacterium]
MSKLVDISGDGLLHYLKRSITKKRTTFWNMLKCISKSQYRPSLFLMVSFALAFVYLISPKPFITHQPLYVRVVHTLLVMAVLLKILSHETYRFTRFKAKGRRSCCD